jgi:hypothetical protein
MIPDVIEKEILIAAPVETVYRAITEPAQIAQWFSDTAELDPAPGGEGRLTFDDRATSQRMAVRLRVQAADAALPARRAAGSRVPPGPQRRNLAGSTVVDRRATPRFKRRPGAVACAPAPLYADHRVLADELVAFPGGATAARYLRARRRQFDEGGLGADEHRLMLTVIALREIRQSLLDAGASRLSTRRTGARPGAGPGSHTGRTRTAPHAALLRQCAAGWRRGHQYPLGIPRAQGRCDHPEGLLALAAQRWPTRSQGHRRSPGCCGFRSGTGPSGRAKPPARVSTATARKVVCRGSPAR